MMMMSKCNMKSFISLISNSSKISNKRFLATYKTSTGLVGLAVDPEGRTTLNKLSNQVLASVQKIPPCDYRDNVEKWFSFISKVTTEKEDILDIEKEIDLGQIEEVIEMAQDELELVDYYYENRGWELVEEAQREAEAMREEMADCIYFTDPSARKEEL